MAIYFFYGEEDFNIEQAVEKLKKELDSNFAAMNFKIVDNPEFSDLIEELRSQALMFGKKLTIIDCLSYFKKSSVLRTDRKVEINFTDSQIKEIETALANNTDNFDIIFRAIIPREERTKNLDSRKKIFKVLSNYNTQEFKAFQFYELEKVVDWVVKSAKSKDLKINQEAAEFLVNNIGFILRKLDSELEKLKTFAYPQKAVTIEMINEICYKNEDVFHFTEAVVNKNFDKALIEYQKLLMTKHPLEIISATQTVLRTKILTKINKNKTYEEIAAIIGEKNPKRIYFKLKEVSHLDLKHLVNLKKNLTEVEYNLKTGRTANEDDEVICAILR